MAQERRHPRRAAWLAVLMLAVVSVALYVALRPRYGLLRLPGDARSALLAETGLLDHPSSLQIREVTQIGPYLAVIYAASGNIGAGLMINEGGSWNIDGVADPGVLRPTASQRVGVAAVQAGGIEVLFLAIADRQIARIVIRYPDGTVLDRTPQGSYSILWRAAPAGEAGFVVESYDCNGRMINP